MRWYSKIFLILGLFVLLGCMAACSKSDLIYTPNLKRNNLIKLAFPNWSEQSIQPIILKEDGVQTFKVSPLYVIRVDDHHAILLTKNIQVDQQGKDACGHSSGDYIGSYLFVHEAQGWKLASRNDETTYFGEVCDIGETSIVRGGSAGFVFVANWHTCYQGYCRNSLELIDLTTSGAYFLGSVDQAASNSGALQECKEINAQAEPDAEAQECFDVQSRWEIKDQQLSMTFSGWLKSAEQPVKVTHINQKTIYEIKNKQLVLISGTNPVPGF